MHVSCRPWSPRPVPLRIALSRPEKSLPCTTRYTAHVNEKAPTRASCLALLVCSVACTPTHRPCIRILASSPTHTYTQKQCATTHHCGPVPPALAADAQQQPALLRLAGRPALPPQMPAGRTPPWPCKSSTRSPQSLTPAAFKRVFEFVFLFYV